MNLYFRFILLLVKSLFNKKSTDMFQACSTKFRVWLFDLDLNFHMNNGRYLTIMDLGRFDLLIKARVFGKLLKNGYYPVVASESIRFKKSLAPFQKFDLISKVESWDERDFFISQTFISNNEVYAVGYIKGRFKKRGQKGSVPTKELFELVGRTYDQDSLSRMAEAQKNIEKELGAFARTDR